ncbi:hypothetical protein [Slackia heliotrinireducens]|uniref:hypothetical protein n=1 Tax=Slackia heliotrinireducens TaxID=84110 RepID=UPI0011AE27B3|nr:hypothetical protein [Slackia heliotrinireducens]
MADTDIGIRHSVADTDIGIRHSVADTDIGIDHFVVETDIGIRHNKPQSIQMEVHYETLRRERT